MVFLALVQPFSITTHSDYAFETVEAYLLFLIVQSTVSDYIWIISSDAKLYQIVKH